MSQNARESLSALMDNEGDDLELRRVLKSLEDDPDAADAWRRYHLMRSLMRRDHDIDVSKDLSAGIMARLEDEPAPALETTPVASRRSPSLARGAGIAAAVSLMVITGVQFYSGSDFARTGDSPVAGTETRSASEQPQRSIASPAGGQGSPLFSPASAGGQAGIMPVGASFDNPLFMSPQSRQAPSSDQEQARLLQSYLDRHSEGAAYRSGDVWMPLLRASGSETLGQR
ncbi:sigma-E factor negative regulatory protein [Billgrantia montanilacus]|jgi:sigma-E factor negative regulatory protein RseA|uniref:Anti-sigma factor n=1 Tax=Billgrantia montanilacus TaxID=2282305 RepID=A0A368TRK1_9GAMM|nr:RseA family anti-sigma factor [Halomonas montanilacus]RCV87345.1 anti-sigma factor [Halomonas montanilacus]